MALETSDAVLTGYYFEPGYECGESCLLKSPRGGWRPVYLSSSSQSAISIKMQSYCRKVRRASTPLTACLSQNGGHHLVWPQRRVPPSKVLEHLLEEAGWRLVLPPAHERLTNNATKPGALHAHLDILLTLADLVRSARPNASRFPITLTAPRLSSATSAQRTPEIDKTA